MRISYVLIAGAILVSGLIMPKKLTAQTVTFEEDFGTESWTENGINWDISVGDIRSYVPHTGSMSWGVIGFFGGDELTSSSCINVSKLWLYIDNMEETMSNFSIKGYDVNNNLIDTQNITIADYENVYGEVSLNWDNIIKLQVSWQDPEGEGAVFIDDLDYSTNPPDITFTNGANASLSFSQPTPSPPQDNWPLGQFSLTSSTTSSQLGSVTVSLGGSYSGLNGSNPFRLYASDTNDFSGASAIGSDATASGGSVTFSSLNDPLPSGTRYYWVTADLSSSATGTINGTIGGSGSLTYTSESGENSGSSSYGVLNTGSDASLPVSISSFSAHCEDQSILLEWTTESETDNLGFVLERKTATSSDWEVIASYQSHESLKGKGNTSERNKYEFTDHKVTPNNKYWYRLSDVDFQGKANFYDVIGIQFSSMDILESHIEQAYPNPFNPVTKFQYHLSENKNIHLHIVDIQGRHIQTLYRGWQNTGSYNMYWNGMNGQNMRMPTGCYFIVLEGENLFEAQKIILLR